MFPSRLYQWQFLANLNCGALSRITCVGFPLLAINRLSVSRNCSAVISFISSKWMALTVTQVKRYAQIFLYIFTRVGCTRGQKGEGSRFCVFLHGPRRRWWKFVRLEIVYRYHSNELPSSLPVFLEESNIHFWVELTYETRWDEKVSEGIPWWVVKWKGSFWEEVLDILHHQVFQHKPFFHGNEVDHHHEVECQVDNCDLFCLQFYLCC